MKKNAATKNTKTSARYVVRSYRRQDATGANMWYRVIDTKSGRSVRSGLWTEREAQQVADAWESRPEPVDEVLVDSRQHYTFNDPDFPEGHLVRNAHYQHLLPGDICKHSVAAPGYGHVTYRITRTDEQGAWGVVIENTVRIARAEDER